MDKIQVQYEADISKLKADLNALEAELKGVDSAADKSAKGVEDSFNKSTKSVNSFSSSLKTAAASLAAVIAVERILEFGKAIIDTTAKFQKFSSVLTNTLGSRSEAQKALQMIADFAKTTPFAVEELTESFVKLANQGFKPTKDEMKKMGDLAAAMGKSFDQLTEAIIDAQTGEFERLKEFGIRASKEGDKVTFTFKGVKKQVDFTNDSIRNYILSLGDLSGVAGAAAASANTLGGQLNNLGDSVDKLLLSIGERFGGVISDAIAGIAGLVEGITEFIEIPMSEKLEAEQMELNNLVHTLMNANDNQQLRNRLLDEIQTKYPEFLKNLDRETVTADQLRQRLAEVNSQYVAKIALQRHEEKITEQAEEQADAFERLYEAERKLTAGIDEVNKKFNLQQKQGESQIDFAKRLNQELIRTNQGRATQKLVGLIGELEDAQEEMNEEDSLGNELLKEKLDLEKKLGITTAEALNKTEENTEANKSNIVTIESLKKKITELQKERETTDITDRKKIASINQEIESTQLLIKRLEGQDEATKKARKELEEFNKAKQKSSEISKELEGVSLDPITELDPKTEQQKDKDVRDRFKKMHKSHEDYLKGLEKAYSESNKKISEDEVKSDQEKRDRLTQYAEFARNMLQTILSEVELRQQMQTDEELQKNDERAQNEINTLQKRKDAGIITEEQFEKRKEGILAAAKKREAAIKTKDAQNDKRLALFKIGIDTAAAIIKQLTVTPYPAAIPFLAIIGATAALQAAIVASKPIPKFKKGGEIKGRSHERGGEIIEAEGGEYMINKKSTVEHRQEVEAINKGFFEQHVQKKYVRPALVRLEREKREKEGSMARNMNNMVQLMKNNEFYDGDIIRAINRKDSYKISNVRELARAISRQQGYNF